MYRIGYTTGVFDLFHIGHLNILQKAKEQCRYLIVGINSDELTMQYKDKTPVIPIEERVKIVRSIKCVDEVSVRDSLDKVEAWKEFHYNAIFQGSDWVNSKAYPGAKLFLEGHGCDIVLFDYTVTTSSTLVMNTLKLINSEKASIVENTINNHIL